VRLGARRFPWELSALPALAIARVFPDYGLGLGLKLAAATLCLLLPGALIARALGERGPSSTLGWSLAGVFAATAVMFAVHGSLRLGLILYAVVGAVALVFSVRSTDGLRRGPSPLLARLWALAPGTGFILVLGIAFAIALWHLASPLSGDALFHLARVRKLDAFGSLSLRTVDEFKDGGLHPGYAFPLWHSFLALVGRFAGVDAALVFRHESSVLAPLAFGVAYEAGLAVFRSAWAGLAAMFAQLAIFGVAAGHGGSYTALDLPATAARQLLVPAVIALFFLFAREPSAAALASLAAASLALAVIHPTYALFVAIPLAGYAVVRVLATRGELVRSAVGLAGVVAPTGLFFLWLLPLVRETASHNPSSAERLRGIRHYSAQLDVSSAHHFRLAPEVFGRTGAVAVAALVAVPLAGLASRRRWAAFVLGGSLAVLGLMLMPELFTRFSDAVSLSQSRRAAGFLPFAFAFAGGAVVLARFLGFLVLPVALAAGIVLEHEYPGNFAYGGTGGPALAAWIAAYGGLAALAVAVIRRGTSERPGFLAAGAAALFVIPVAVHGFSRWSSRGRDDTLPASLVAAVRQHVPAGAIVFSDDATSYRLLASAPVYVALALPGHVADTTANHPYERRKDSVRFFRTGDLSIPRRYHAQFVLLDRARYKLRLSLPRLYSDRSYVLFRFYPSVR
jgi:hypothetical protein